MMDSVIDKNKLLDKLKKLASFEEMKREEIKLIPSDEVFYTSIEYNGKGEPYEYENFTKNLCWDTEEIHRIADQLLLDYINDKEITDAFRNIRKWYS